MKQNTIKTKITDLKEVDDLCGKIIDLLLTENNEEGANPSAINALTRAAFFVSSALIETKAFRCNHPKFDNALCAFNIASRNLEGIFEEIYFPTALKLDEEQAEKVLTHFLEDKPGNPVLEINGEKIEVPKENLYIDKDELEKFNKEKINNNKEDK